MNLVDDGRVITITGPRGVVLRGPSASEISKEAQRVLLEIVLSVGGEDAASEAQQTNGRGDLDYRGSPLAVRDTMGHLGGTASSGTR